jgi:hypothetical protein
MLLAPAGCGGSGDPADLSLINDAAVVDGDGSLDHSSLDGAMAMPDLIAPADLGPPDLRCPTMSLLVYADAVTALAATQPDLSPGGRATFDVGGPLASVGLTRFDLSALPQSADVLSARVTYSFAATSSDCSANCGSCADLDHAGNLALYWARNDWVEASATWRSTGNGPWGMSGASLVGVDRGATPIANAGHNFDSDTVFTIDPTELDELTGNAWRQNDEISIEMIPFNNAVFIVATEHSADEGCVKGGYRPPRLELFYCP